MPNPEATVVWEILEEDRLELSGGGRVAFLNSYVTQDVKTLPVDGVKPGAFLTQKGKLVSEVQILHLGEKFLLLFPAGYGEKVLAHLATFLMFADAAMNPSATDYAHFVFRGAQAPALLASLGLPITAQEDASLQRLTFSNNEALVFPSRTWGPQAWELLVQKAAAAALQQRLQAQAAQGALHLATAAEIETLRIESSIPKMGVDMGEENLVAEVGLDERATSFSKGCYLGQETTARVQSRGHVNRKLDLLKLSQAFSGPLPADLLQGEKKVGTLTSAVISPKLGPIGLGTVQLSAWEQAQPITVSGTDATIQVSKG